MNIPAQVPQLPAERQDPVVESETEPRSQALMVLRPDGWSSSPEFAPGSPVTMLPVELDVAVPVRDFRVHNLLALECGQVIETQWGHGDDVPLASHRVPLAWSEFEVMDSQLGVRVTRLV